VNVTLPILRTALDVRTHTRVPDPRLPSFALPPGNPMAGTVTESDSDASEGVGDILLRAKYVVRRGAPADLAVGLGLSLPSGRPDDFQGTGRTLVEPLLIASRRLGQRVELLANAGADLDAEDVDRTVLRWAIGGTATIVGPLAAAVVFLGRQELARQTDPIPLPFFFQIERNQIYDASVGLRWRFAESGILSLNGLFPLNQDGLRADVTPTVELGYVF
jgi:outer membrane putative beta-barrel porin/alpha-amylase